VRTIRRDIESLRQKEIIVATRGQVRDIGPGVTHRGIAVRLWLEGKEPVEIARHIAGDSEIYFDLPAGAAVQAERDEYGPDCFCDRPHEAVDQRI